MSKYLCYMPLLFALFKSKWERILYHVITFFAMCCAHVFYFQHTTTKHMRSNSFCQHVFSAKDINGLAGSVPSPERNQKKSGATGTLYSREKCYLTHTVYCDNLRQKTMKKTSILSSQIIMTNTHRCEIGISNGSHYYI